MKKQGTEIQLRYENPRREIDVFLNRVLIGSVKSNGLQKPHWFIRGTGVLEGRSGGVSGDVFDAARVLASWVK